VGTSVSENTRSPVASYRTTTIEIAGEFVEPRKT